MKSLLLVVVTMMFFLKPVAAAPTLVSKDDYVVGGIVGSVVGFGIGHAVQSRYSDYGWVFSIGEGLGVAGWKIIPWIMEASGYIGRAPTIISRAGLSVLVGLRLWQITDLWVFTRPHHPISAMMQEKPWQKGWWGAERETDLSTVEVSLLRW